MRTTVIWVLLAIGGLAGRKSMDSEVESPSADLQFNGSGLKFPGKSDVLTVFLQSLKDTRCPQNVICIQPGWVELSVLVRNSTDSVRVETLFYANTEKDKVKTFKLGDNEYGLRVYQVLPFPQEGKNLKIEDYTVGLNISPI